MLQVLIFAEMLMAIGMVISFYLNEYKNKNTDEIYNFCFITLVIIGCMAVIAVK